MMDICFASVPFIPIERPVISFGLFQSILNNADIKATTLNFSLDFAEQVGPKNYQTMSRCAYVLFGEWVFSPCLLKDEVNTEGYLKSLIKFLQSNTVSIPLNRDRNYLLHLRQTARDFLKKAAEDLVRDYHPKIVACSSMYSNHIACVSLLKFVKEISPETVTMIGGPNCEGEMGIATHKLFPFVDYVVSGYADHLITELCRKIFAYGKDMPVHEVPKQVLAPVFREIEYKQAIEHLEPPMGLDLSGLPIPDYHEYFNRLDSSEKLRKTIRPAIPIESARGCYWAKCKFCGVKNHTDYRQKKWEQVYNEIITLTEKHKTKNIMFTDNATNFNTLSRMLDKLSENSSNLQMWAEVRIELKRKHFKKMKEAGVTMLQAGIESLNDNFLDCMRKGASMLQNIKVIKFSQQYGMFIFYNIMHSFPGEKDQWYLELEEIIPYLVHLHPPRGMTKLRFDRFSDYYLNQAKYGLDLKALDVYSQIYPYDQSTLNQIAYFFEDKKEYRTRKNPILYHLFYKPTRNFRKVDKMIQDWIKNYYSEAPWKLTYKINEKKVLIHDTRPISSSNDYVLNEPEGEIFLLCDEIRSVKEINDELTGKYNAADIDKALASLIDKKIILKRDDKLLSLAVEEPVPSISHSSAIGIILEDAQS
jgi:magnesium-protoporphyrin IX monomethyl ester (oxidative) cyclase